jgi:hypothetical protein
VKLAKMLTSEYANVPYDIAPAEFELVIGCVAINDAPDTAPVLVKLVRVPTLVKLEETILLASVVPVSDDAGATVDTVADPPSAIVVPLIVTLLFANAEFAIGVKPEPIDPLVNIPTLVKLLDVTVELSPVPVSVNAAAGTVIATEPSKFTPLICVGVKNLDAVDEFPVTVPVKLPVTLPVKLPVTLPVKLPAPVLIPPKIGVAGSTQIPDVPVL